jgi:hypothetical protein
MSKYLIALCLALTCAASYAQKPVETNKKIVCFPVKVLMKDLKDKYGEEPMVMGTTSNMSDVAMALYLNKETGSYTIIEFDREAACVISIGKDVRYRFPKTGTML